MIDAAIVSDAAYFPWCGVLCASIGAAHRPGSVRVHLLHDASPTAEDLRAMSELASSAGVALELHAIDAPRVAHFPAAGGYGPIVWLRFLLPELLGEVERVLYLDADTFVADDLAELDATDLGGLPLAAVENVATPSHPSRARELGLAPDAPYFNSGVLLMDLVRWRDDGWQARLLECARERGASLRYPDQDALNLVFAGAWLPVEPRWNCQNSLFFARRHAEATFGAAAVARAVEHPAVVHFEGPPLTKPWHVISPHPWTARYRRTLAATPFAGTPLDGATPLNRAIATLPARWRFPVVRGLQAAKRTIGTRGR